MRGLALAAVIAASMIALGCGSDDEDADRRERALSSLKLATEASRLEGETGELVRKLADDPSAQERRRLQRRLTELDRQAEKLMARAGVEPTYEVDLQPVNASGASGKARLVQAGSRLAVDGKVTGAAGDGPHQVAIHALSAAEGASVCPPAEAATGADRHLSDSEAADFYGAAKVRFAAVEGAKLESARKDAGAAPLTARALVITGGKGKGGFDRRLPIACGVPVPAATSAGRRPTASDEIVAGAAETRAAGVDLAVVAANPTSKPAARARARIETRFKRADARLGRAIDLIGDELKGEGDLAVEDRRALQESQTIVDASEKVHQAALLEFERFVIEQKRAQERRTAQRRKAQEQAQAAPAPTPAPSPTPAPTPAPAPAPAPGPAPPSVVIE